MIDLWMIYILLAIVAVIVETFMPTFFCINFAFAGVITALISIFCRDFYITMAIFLVLSLISILFIKPMLIRYFKIGAKADFDEQYIGKIVKVIETITQNSGAVTIYDERWEARVKVDNQTIEKGCDVKIIGNDSLILFVEKV